MLFTMFAMSPALAGQLGATPEDHLHQARRSLREVDLEGVRLHVRRALETDGPHQEEARYLLGMSWQLDDRPADALAIYREAYARHPNGAFNDQLEFGIAETTAATGDPKHALRWLRKARRGHLMSIEDAPKFAIDRALFILQKGRLKRGTKLLLEALDETDHDLATWHQARARTYLVEQWLDLADHMDLGVPEQVERRAVLIAKAQEQVLASTHLPHHTYMLDQLYRLGASYEKLGDDVVQQYGSVDALPEDARTRTENVWVKATRTYDIGVRHAARTAELDTQAAFEAAEAAITQKVDRL